MKIRSLVLYGALGAGAFAFGAGWNPGHIPAWGRYLHARASFDMRYHPSVDPFWNGPEILMVYIGQSHCAPSNALELPQMVEDIKAGLSRFAEASGARFRAVGLSLDFSPVEGIDHLAKFGEFDELRAGGGTFSDSAMEFLWQGFPGTVATPQIVVIRRERVSPKDRQAPVEYSLKSGLELDRMIGLDGIGNWSLDGHTVERYRTLMELASTRGT